jgi:hypothetical protein
MKGFKTMQRNMFFISLFMLPAQAMAHPGHDDMAMSLLHSLTTLDHFTALFRKSPATASLLCLGVLFAAVSVYKVAVKFQVPTMLAKLLGGITAVVGTMLLVGISA